MKTINKNYQEILEAHEKIIYTVKGVSMLPMLHQRRDVVIIENKLYGMYDVVLFKRLENNGHLSYVLHRIVKKYKDGSFLIMGDNTYSGDVVKPEDIIGVLTSFYRDGKKVKVTNWRYKLYVFCYCAPYKLRIAIKKSFIIRCFKALVKMC